VPINPFGIGFCLAYECSRCKQSEWLRDKSSAREWLAQFQRDPSTMSYLRTIAVKCGYNRLNVLDNHAIVELLAADIASGWIRACDRTQETYGAGSAAADAPPDTTPKLFPLADRSPRVSDSPPQATTEPPTFPPNLDGAAQASALAAAAASGKPFCAH
jgi:hypothetical protein